MKKSILSFLLSAICMLSVASAIGRDGVDTATSGRFCLSAGAGILPGDWFEKVIFSQYNRYSLLPVACYTGAVKYVLNKNFTLSVSATYYEHKNNYTARYPVREYENPSSIGYEMSYSHHEYSYKTLVIAAGATIVYYRMPATTRTIYGGADVGLAHITGKRESEHLYYFPNNPGMVPFDSDFSREEVNENKIKAHVTLLGIRGGRKIGWYAEAGYGFKGILNAGVSVRL